RKGLTITESMRQAHLEFWRQTDPLAIWLLVNTLDTPEGLVPRSALIHAYNSAAAREGRAGMSEMAFGLALKRLRPSVKDVQRTMGGRPKVWCYQGITLITREYDTAGQNVA